MLLPCKNNWVFGVDQNIVQVNYDKVINGALHYDGVVKFNKNILQNWQRLEKRLY